jgi:preprotein translocase subunit SecD
VKKRWFLIAGLLTLAGCAPLNVSYELHFVENSAGREHALADAAARVVEGRLGAMKQTLNRKEVSVQGTGAILRLAISDPAAGEQLTSALTAPFTFDIMVEAPKDKADAYNEQLGGYRRTGLSEKQIDWVTSGQVNGTGFVIIGLTKEGQDIYSSLTKENQGKKIAIFNRKNFVTSKVLAPEDQKKGALQIDNIPSPQIASIFADDVNVGAHVIFIPLQEKKAP